MGETEKNQQIILSCSRMFIGFWRFRNRLPINNREVLSHEEDPGFGISAYHNICARDSRDGGGQCIRFRRQQRELSLQRHRRRKWQSVAGSDGTWIN